ncbi:hypothetical protein [Moorena sp. SIO3I6]|nr:hypothetical protein [Moorena sp. SIO3I6]NEP28046.1 hypothetical protein [Moorena sp. SIO3I6]
MSPPQAVPTKAIGNHINLSKALPTLHELKNNPNVSERDRTLCEGIN